MSIEYEFNLDFGEMDDRIRAVLPAAVERGMEVIRAAAVEKTPWETHHLQESATVSVDPANNSGAVHYPGPYARYQHERLDLRHDRGGQAKFLEAALMEKGPDALNIIATDVRRALGG